MTIKTAFLVCAGMGTRMKPLTDTSPKPLLVLNGRPILDYIFDHLRKTNVDKVTVNSHYLASQITSYLQTIKDFAITESFEAVLLETGGGLVKALDTLGKEPFLMINGDAFWIDQKGHNTLKELESEFDPLKMDILLCVIPVTRMILTEGVGDYDFLPDGRLCRNLKKNGTHMFTGIRIINPQILSGHRVEKFSFLETMDQAEKNGRLYGYALKGDWHHISTPDDLISVQNHLEPDRSKR